MSTSHRIALALSLVLALNVMAADQNCAQTGTATLKNTPELNQPAHKKDCPPPDQPCDKKDDVGVMSWILGSHRMPTMHFIDFVEIFLR